MPPRDSDLPPASSGHQLIGRVFAADRQLDTEAFVQLLTTDVVLRIGSQPAIIGIDAVRQAINGLFAAMRSGVEHTLRHAWTDHDPARGNSLVYQAEALFHLKDGRDLSLPYVNVLRITPSGLVSHYLIYIDLSPMYSPRG